MIDFTDDGSPTLSVVKTTLAHLSGRYYSARPAPGSWAGRPPLNSHNNKSLAAMLESHACMHDACKYIM
jgi:hypothetical protein